MYCPRCSHQAASDNLRFCPGCGFRMDGVAELLANYGFSPAYVERPPKPRRSTVKRGALLGAMLMFIGPLVIVPIHTRGPDGKETFALILFYWLALMALIGVSGYLKRMMSKIFSEVEPSPSKKIESPRGAALAVAYSAPGADSGRRSLDTATTGQPSSVTEQTTSRFNNA
ncbi:MAG: hypothetical protein J2P21_18405 [Chloracidobacterium sp.]|nr:hypothetical protein [Chloracidobacterium sp.]